jgi:SAM-dependent MidA family methyltransferase
VAADLAQALVALIHRHGPLPFDRYVEHALYDPGAGFYATGRGAGRQGADFVTSPEVGPLYGRLVARALDGWWAELGHPDPFVVVEAGAGRGVLARDVLAAAPACAPALRYVLVERSPRLAARQHELVRLEPAAEELGRFAVRPGDDGEIDDDGPELPVAGTGPRCCALDRLPAVHVDGVVLANELLDNLAFRIVERGPDGWSEVRVGVDDGAQLVEVVVPADDQLAAHADALTTGVDVPPGVRLPVQAQVGAWVSEACVLLRRGWVVAVDYAATVPELVAREALDPSGWLRTYAGHARGRAALDAPGEHDVTVDVVEEEFARAAVRAGARPEPVVTQAEWLRGLGIDDLAARAAAEWQERAAVGDLAALAARSRVSEAAALTDPTGLGAHRVLAARIR